MCFLHVQELDYCNFWILPSGNYFHKITKMTNFPIGHLLVHTDMMNFLDQNQDKFFHHLLEQDCHNFWILISGNYFHKMTKRTTVPNCRLSDTDLQYMK